MRDTHKDEPKRRLRIRQYFLSGIFFLLALGMAIYILGDVMKKKKAQDAFEELSKEMQKTTQEVVVTPQPTPESIPTASPLSVENEQEEVTEEIAEEVTEEDVVKDFPIEQDKIVDIKKLQETVESDICAWIYIPDTKIDYPVLQHPTDNAYYLNHNLDGTSGYPGCIYIENYNRNDFLDPNTVVYGHNMKNGTMLAGVHKFKDPTYFEEHPYVYIYLSDKVQVYEIFGVYENGDEHLLYGKDMSNETIFNAYLDTIEEKAKSGKGNWKEEVVLTEHSKLVTLSTCIGGKSDKRLLLQAVLCGEASLQ